MVGNATHWIGLRKVKGNFQWFNGKRYRFAYWKPGEPNEGDAASCVATNAITGQWLDSTCNKVTDKRGIVCEKHALV
ncbi:unnamed protein product [Dracunculus medinensis]|uniref:C-type lectin domain-containing protein n=1 Tax=Dracunculus medinensis TaxID=318479 RepID=A0A0N4U181_DRAME|nr:unnamed protein product [Dracunculus medinensis]